MVWKIEKSEAGFYRLGEAAVAHGHVDDGDGSSSSQRARRGARGLHRIMAILWNDLAQAEVRCIGLAMCASVQRAVRCVYCPGRRGHVAFLRRRCSSATRRRGAAYSLCRVRRARARRGQGEVAVDKGRTALLAALLRGVCACPCHSWQAPVAWTRRGLSRVGDGLLQGQVRGDQQDEGRLNDMFLRARHGLRQMCMIMGMNACTAWAGAGLERLPLLLGLSISRWHQRDIMELGDMGIKEGEPWLSVSMVECKWAMAWLRQNKMGSVSSGKGCSNVL